jgi:hypothetical protein
MNLQTGMSKSGAGRLILLSIAGLCLMALGGCSPAGSRVEAVPESLSLQATIEGYHNVRFYSSDFESGRKLAEDAVQIVREAHPGQDLKGRVVRLDYLSISGGGEDGAFGAGLLNGWSASGIRPKFDVVTGVSTGSLIAPFAFLGSEYDDVLKQAYTTTSTADVVNFNYISAVLGLAPGISSNDLFEKLIARYLTPQIFEAIAHEYHKGRMLLIGTTNLESQQPVIWNIGAIAASGKPGALDLARHIIMASASIPGVFPPVRLQVTVDGKFYDELHADGGVTRQVFLLPAGYDTELVDKAIGWKAQRRAFIIRNGLVRPEYQAVNDSFLPLALRSVSTLIKTQGVGDLYRIYLFCQRYDIQYNLAYIPNEFEAPSHAMFDEKFMNSLYDFGYQEGVRGYSWHKRPPGLEKNPS